MNNSELKIARQCGVTLAGIKPSSLFRVKCEDYSAFSELRESFKSKGIAFTVLRRTKHDFLVFVYNIKMLAAVLSDECAVCFLQGFGYNYSCVQSAVKQLKKRMLQKGFPHEIGVFLGYPLEDVQGFIRSAHCGYKHCGTWKVYQDAPGKKQTFLRYRKCTENICKKIRDGRSLAQIFNVN